MIGLYAILILIAVSKLAIGQAFSPYAGEVFMSKYLLKKAQGTLEIQVATRIV